MYYGMPSGTDMLSLDMMVREFLRQTMQLCQTKDLPSILFATRYPDQDFATTRTLSSYPPKLRISWRKRAK
ncbi:hypothetical protein NLJ89_g11274 [Agrocybe chaxingu]|uniref:Uncharacterized protein n=1 Tax=Agrocybe chaxingu TaxID=84603 RepID=A0A9W8MRB1_9AGAR|nr:hypothetical protein NLJ89_g11274 [Agrocybe chaxingu]